MNVYYFNSAYGSRELSFSLYSFNATFTSKEEINILSKSRKTQGSQMKILGLLGSAPWKILKTRNFQVFICPYMVSKKRVLSI